MPAAQRRFGLAAGGVVVVLLAAGCGASGATTHTAAPSVPARPAASAPAGTATTSTTVAGPRPFDPTKPIDLGGTPGVTPAEQHRAETLLRSTIVALKQYATPVQAYAAGYRSIGDGLTGDEHYVKWSLVDDGHILDPALPESLVYERIGGQQRIAAAMYMLPYGSRFTDAPDVGGALTQWHVHRDLCFTDGTVQKSFAGIVGVDGNCAPGTSKAGSMPMLHVWVVPNRCGPFAALDGVGAGQVPAGQTRLCDTAHGSI